MSVPSKNEEDELVTRTFNPNDHLMQIKNRNGSADYLPVQWRLVWFRELCPEGSIETEMLHLDLNRETEEEGFQWNQETRRSEKIIKRANGIAVFRATVKDGKGGIATGTKSEKAASFPDYIEKAETGSIGRALAALGYGTQFAPELNEEHRIADAPVDRPPARPQTSGNSRTASSVTSRDEHIPIATEGKRREPNDAPGIIRSPSDTSSAPATDQQIANLRKLCHHLDKPEPEDLESMEYQEAKALITHLSHEYNEQKQKRVTVPAAAAQYTLNTIKKRAFDTGVVTTKGGWQLFNADVCAEFVPDEKLRGDQALLKLLDEEITARAAQKLAS